MTGKIAKTMHQAEAVTQADPDLDLVIDLVIEDEGWAGPDCEIDCELLKSATRAALAAAKGVVATKARARGAEIAILLASDERIRDLNRQYRAKDAPTNVLSFPAGDSAGLAPAGPVLLGDIALARQTVMGEAEASGIPLVHHAAHLVCHGMLHLLEYDHMTDNDAVEMESLEVLILESLGIPDPYQPGDARGPDERS